MIIAGIDPGQSGAMAIMHSIDKVDFFDVPMMKLKGKQKPAWGQWAHDWAEALANAKPALIVIEEVSARPGQGVTSMFNFGRSLGFAHALVAGLGRPVHFVTPQKWKAKMGLLNSNKAASIDKLVYLMPLCAANVRRAKDSGRAEAALLAYYGRRYLCSEILAWDL